MQQTRNQIVRFTPPYEWARGKQKQYIRNAIAVRDFMSRAALSL